jgi:hypothetical protein
MIALNFSQTKLTDQKLKDLLNQQEDINTISSLDVSGNQLTDGIIDYLAAKFSESKQLRYLNLSKNQLLMPNLNALAKIVSLRELLLLSNLIEPSAMANLKIPSLFFLDLRGNSVSANILKTIYKNNPLVGIRAKISIGTYDTDRVKAYIQREEQRFFTRQVITLTEMRRTNGLLAEFPKEMIFEIATWLAIAQNIKSPLVPSVITLVLLNISKDQKNVGKWDITLTNVSKGTKSIIKVFKPQSELQVPEVDTPRSCNLM